MDEQTRTNLVLAAAIITASRLTESQKANQSAVEAVDEVIMTLKIMEEKGLAPPESTKFVSDPIRIRVPK